MEDPPPSEELKTKRATLEELDFKGLGTAAGTAPRSAGGYVLLLNDEGIEVEFKSPEQLSESALRSLFASACGVLTSAAQLGTISRNLAPRRPRGAASVTPFSC